jgi:uncharacterized protein (TIGR00369 family)
MTEAREGPFWDSIEGRAPKPKSAELLGWSLDSIDPDAGTIVVRFEARDAFTNHMGNIQGGFLAAMLDDTMGPALIATLPPGYLAPTLEMKVSFLQPASVGILWGHGRVVNRGRSIGFVEGISPMTAAACSRGRVPPLASSRRNRARPHARSCRQAFASACVKGFSELTAIAAMSLGDRCGRIHSSESSSVVQMRVLASSMADFPCCRCWS